LNPGPALGGEAGFGRAGLSSRSFVRRTTKAAEHFVARTLRHQLTAEGPSLLATFVLVPRVEIVELVAIAGFDVVVIDLEHGPYGVESLPPLIAAALARGLLCVVRVRRLDVHGIGAALDCGADGVLVPHVASRANAEVAVHAARFPPEGNRGANPYVRAAAYSAESSFLTEANRSAACLVLVEGRAGVAAVDQIAGVPGLDGVFVGPVDLSADAGVPGETDSPLVQEAVKNVVASARAHGVATCVFAEQPESARRWIEMGVRMVTLSVDTALILRGFRAAIADLDKTVDSAHGSPSIPGSPSPEPSSRMRV
jgi:4-hydroxy-2-oxoheptanedioate aldolase